MQVKELVEKLLSMPEDAYIVIDRCIVHGIDLQEGKCEIGYLNPVFRLGKGRDKAVLFLSNTELSDGSICSKPV